jgi:hypothetical protein
MGRRVKERSWRCWKQNNETVQAVSKLSNAREQEILSPSRTSVTATISIIISLPVCYLILYLPGGQLTNYSEIYFGGCYRAKTN